MVAKAMSKNTSFTVGEHFIGFIEAQVGKGRYSNASEVVRAGLRLLEEREAALATLRSALVEGEQSGISPRSVADIWAAVKEGARTERG
jgi:antitoxin ParD1/3/4